MHNSQRHDGELVPSFMVPVTIQGDKNLDIRKREWNGSLERTVAILSPRFPERSRKGVCLPFFT
jgi:hypothetical protein